MERVNELHRRIKDLRNKYGLTQQQVADRLGIEVSTYAHYEKGDRTPDAGKLAKLAELYKLNDELLGSVFPIEIFVSYKRKDVERLRIVLDECKWIEGDNKHNRHQYRKLRAAAEPILKAREEALSIPDIDIRKYYKGMLIATVKLDRVGEALIDQYYKELNKYFELVDM